MIAIPGAISTTILQEVHLDVMEDEDGDPWLVLVAPDRKAQVAFISEDLRADLRGKLEKVQTATPAEARAEALKNGHARKEPGG